METEKELALKKLFFAVWLDCFVTVFCILWEMLGIFFGVLLLVKYYKLWERIFSVILILVFLIMLVLTIRSFFKIHYDLKKLSHGECRIMLGKIVSCSEHEDNTGDVSYTWFENTIEDIATGERKEFHLIGHTEKELPPSFIDKEYTFYCTYNTDFAYCLEIDKKYSK